MEILAKIMPLIHFVKDNWLQIVGVVVLFEKFIQAVSILTPWAWDDKIAAFIDKWASKLPGKN